ncbi:MAG: DUF1015 domain-containing protein, partial [Bacteroidales bacterium]|nr:DUF1015 domain-containing protein [Bacteroidales bacterium]
MAVLKAFKGIRPLKDKAARIASRPYDVLNKEEARAEAGDNELSFLHVIKPEIDLPDDMDHYSQEVYQKGKENFFELLEKKVLFQDEEDYLYVYAQTMNGKTQYGLVGCASVDDYLNNVIKKHELTRPDKEEDRMNHVRVSGMNYEPVFFSYPAVAEIDEIVGKVIQNDPEYDFTAEDGVGHHFWVIRDKETIDRISELFDKIPSTYVADGHHRTAAAALVGKERRENNPNHTGNEEYNYFLAVHFPDDQLNIIDYNRLIKDLNGLSKTEFIEKLNESFEIEKKGPSIYKPEKLHNFSMYLEGEWYSLTAKNDTYDDNDPIGVLDVTILTKQVLVPVLDIEDLRRSKRI